MAIKPGDKVRFLNDVGGGIVKGFQNKNVVMVLQDDGFEVPILIRECVVVEQATEMKKTGAPAVVVQTEEEPEFNYTEDPKKGDETDIILGVVNEEEGAEKVFNAYLINDSNYFIQFIISKKEQKNHYLIEAGTLEPNTKLLLDTWNPQDFQHENTLVVQLAFFKKKKHYAPQQPILKEIKIGAITLMTEKGFDVNDYFHQKALIFKLTPDPLEEKIQQLTNAEIESVIKEKEARPRIKRAQKRTPGEIHEIDLHIEALLDDIRGLSNAEMLKYQLDKFHEALLENAKFKGQRIVFIHGVGNGVLKADILKVLKRNRTKYDYQDASFKEYGYGATMVIIK